MRTAPLWLLLLGACSARGSLAAERAALLELHEAQRRAHLAEDAPGLVALFDDGFFDLREGGVRHPTRAESSARLASYFGAVEFLAWDDLAPPEIRLAEDGSLATMAVTKLVRLRTPGPDGAPRIERTLFAWLATCVRRPEGWRIAGVASTRMPEDAASTSLAALRHALGGDERIARLAGVRASLRGSGPSGDYRLELELPRGAPWRFCWLFPGRPASTLELDGPAGWSLDAAGARTALAPAEVLMVRSHAFPWLALDLAAFFPTIEHAGTRLESGRTLERLRLTDALGQPATAELDLANDRLASLELLDTRSDPPATVRIDFETWREHDGLLLPERVVAHDSRGAWALELEQVELSSEP